MLIKTKNTDVVYFRVIYSGLLSDIPQPAALESILKTEAVIITGTNLVVPFRRLFNLWVKTWISFIFLGSLTILFGGGGEGWGSHSFFL